MTVRNEEELSMSTHDIYHVHVVGAVAACSALLQGLSDNITSNSAHMVFHTHQRAVVTYFGLWMGSGVEQLSKGC